MDANEYQKQAARTIALADKALERINANPEAVDLLHCILGISSELGEMADAVKRWLFYGSEFDAVNFQEEIGDSQWYHAQGLTAIQARLADVMQKNLDKLRHRFPEKFSDEQAAEENRDREGERGILEGKLGRDGLKNALAESQSLRNHCNICGQALPCDGRTPHA